MDGDGFAYDRHGAGTAVAGIIAANQRNGVGIAGLMKKVTLLPVRYIDNNGQTSIGALSSALDAALKLKPHVIFVQTAQIQLGGHSQNPGLIADELGILKPYLNKLRDAKIAVVIGAGDDMSTFGSGEMDKLLRGYENIFVVTAVDKDGRRTLLANTHNQDVVTAAPGEGVLSLAPGNKYAEVNGTAFAAAHLTAALALARAQLADRTDLVKIAGVLVNAKGSEADVALERDTRGGTRLQIVKFLSEIKNL
ncbi:MAG: S8 family serine peptidase [Calothrix sp. SM1_5_4]|nr:S8 family serine peptidase [Calothrix sp. SM1_5_4]